MKLSIKKLFLSFLVIILFPLPVQCFEEKCNLDFESYLQVGDDEFDYGDYDFDFMFPWGVDIDEPDEPEDNLSAETRGIPDDSVLTNLAKTICSPVWEKTHPPRTRNPLHLLPLARMALSDTSGMFFMPFFNKTDVLTIPFVNPISLNVDVNVLVEMLKLAQSEGHNIDSEGVVNLLPLLRRLSIEERKAGVVLQLNWARAPFFFQFDTAILLGERNLFGSKEVQDQIEQAIIQAFGEEFLGIFDKKREFARIKIGIGAMRLRVGFPTIDRKGIKINVGIGAILPTASGTLLDGRFKKPHAIEVNNSFDFLINNMRRIVLNPELGNNGHFGMNLFLDAKIPLYRDTFLFRASFSYDKLFSSRSSFRHIITSRQKRLIMFKQRVTITEVNERLVQGVSDTTVLSDFQRQYLIPQFFEVTINPGDIFMLTFALDGRIHNWKIRGGYNYYLQQSEKFKALRDSTVNINELRIHDAISGSVSQHKLAVEGGYTKCIQDMNTSINVGFDYSVASRRLSRDWTIYCRVGVSF